MRIVKLMTMGFWAAVAVLVLMSGTGGVEAYQNYTVGDSLGWYDNIMKPSVDYAKWAAGKNFSLGDFLTFNTDTNHSVVQTYNETTYKNCDFLDSSNDTTEWSNAAPSPDVIPTTVSVPLTKEGINYFFSSEYEGWQCATGGQKFEINVTYGQGLPAALLVPPAAPPPPPPSTTNVSSTAPSPDRVSASDTAARIDGLFLALTVILMLPFFVIW